MPGQINLFWRYGYTSCLFCKWPSQHLEGKQDPRKLDIKFRKLVRTIVGLPGGLHWSAPWHDVFHKWNARILECPEQAGVKLWSRRCLEQQWKLANSIANTSDNGWFETCPSDPLRGPQDAGQGWGCANANVLPTEKFGKMEGNRQIFGWHIYEFLYGIFDAEVMRVEIRLSFVVSLRPKRGGYLRASRFDTCLSTHRKEEVQWPSGQIEHRKKQGGTRQIGGPKQ